jgi:hypothetical protein
MMLKGMDFAVLQKNGTQEELLSPSRGGKYSLGDASYGKKNS